MDNAENGIHRNYALLQAGRLSFSDLNPIEEHFGKVKGFIRKEESSERDNRHSRPIALLIRIDSRNGTVRLECKLG
jgi:hypothetical protein